MIFYHDAPIYEVGQTAVFYQDGHEMHYKIKAVIYVDGTVQYIVEPMDELEILFPYATPEQRQRIKQTCVDIAAAGKATYPDLIRGLAFALKPPVSEMQAYGLFPEQATLWLELRDKAREPKN